MGRLIRKKIGAKKKKKQSTGDDPSIGASKEIRPNDDSSKKDKIVPQAFVDKNLIGKGIQFLREAKAELKKVTWPTRQVTTGSTVVVIILVMIISFFLGAVDIGLSKLIRSAIG